MAADADSPDREVNDTETSQTPSQEAGSDPVDSEDYDSAVKGTVRVDVDRDDDAGPAKRSVSPERLVLLVGLVIVLVLSGIVGWLGFGAYRVHKDQAERELFLQVGRQGAVNLTTIDWENVGADIQRILDSATGPFYDDFSRRSQPFIDVVKKVQSKSVGTVTEAGLESVSADEARVLVAVSVKTSNLGETDQPPRAWRMRIDVQKTAEGAKVSNVLFVPS